MTSEVAESHQHQEGVSRKLQLSAACYAVRQSAGRPPLLWGASQEERERQIGGSNGQAAASSTLSTHCQPPGNSVLAAPTACFHAL